MLLFEIVQNNIIPNMPGILLLLTMSFFFSTINFYADLQVEQKTFRKVLRYLLVWIAFNYIFALIFLILILPEDVNMATLNRSLFMYCLIATALPELSANLRLQIGESTRRAVDLHKYKVKISQLIASRLEQNVWEDRQKRLSNLDAYFTGRKQQFREKLESCMANPALSSEERTSFSEAIHELDASSDQAFSPGDVLKKYPNVVARLLKDCGEEIEDYEKWIESRLILHLRPRVSVAEARKLVGLGISGPRMFLLRTLFNFQRRKLAEKLRAAGIDSMDENRIRRIHYETRNARRIRFRMRLKWAMGLMALFFIAVSVFNLLVYNQRISYQPLKMPTAITLPEDYEHLEMGSKIIVGKTTDANSADLKGGEEQPR